MIQYLQSFARIKSYIDHAHASPDCDFIAGGTYDDSVGYYVQPTIVVCKDRNDKLLKEVWNINLQCCILEDFVTS